MKKKLVILDENAHWWRNDPEIKRWAIEDKDGTWWLVGGSEFPETKVNKDMKVKHKRIGQRSSFVYVGYMLLILLTALLGISLALNVIHYIL